MKEQICIVGSGTSGLQLAYSLKEDFQADAVAEWFTFPSSAHKVDLKQT